MSIPSRRCYALRAIGPAALAALFVVSVAICEPVCGASVWSSDFEAAKAQAAREKKDVLILVTADFDPNGLKLLEQVFDKVEFQQAALAKFVLVKLDYTVTQKDPQHSTNVLMNRWNVIAVPAILLTDAQGRGYAMFSGYFSEGHVIFSAQLDWLRQLRIRRDEYIAEGKAAAGAARARKLDRALSLVPPNLAAADYQDLKEEILALDKDNAAGLRSKYAEWPGPPQYQGLKKATPEEARQLAEVEALNKQVANLFGTGQLDKALEGAEKASAVLLRILGPLDSRTIACQNNVALIHCFRGDLDQAEQVYWNSIAVPMATLHGRDLQSLGGIAGLGLVLAKKGDYDKAQAALHLATETTRKNLDVAAASQSDLQQFVMAQNLRHRLDIYLAIAAKSGRHQQLAFEQLLAWKGAVLSRQQAVRSAADQPELAPLFSELQKVSAELASAVFSTPSESQVEGWRSFIRERAERKEKLESELSGKSEAYRKARQRFALNDVSQALPAGFALVDFAEYEDLTYQGPLQPTNVNRRLLAFIVCGDRAIQLVNLSSSSEAATAIDAWRATLGRSTDSAAAGQKLRQLVWQPLERHLDGVHTVLISPDGVLGLIPFAALPGKETGKYLIEEQVLAVVPVPQAVPALVAEAGQTKLAGSTSMLVLGGVDYNASMREAAPQKSAEPNKQFARAPAVRGDAGLKFESLAGADGEMAMIAVMYRDFVGERGILTLKGESASEASVRREAPLHSYLHLATHGFFAPAKARSAFSGGSGYHPGLLSGIALAGANQPAAQGDDGILTAAEVETLDLRRSELAVLSACETGLGQVAGGEGLLGLQRAFQAAGAKTVVASLWSVPDQATRLLMVRFYENLWKRKTSKLNALREAQLWMLQRGTEQAEIRRELAARGLKEFDGDSGPGKGNVRLTPYYWAAWVLSGDWR